MINRNWLLVAGILVIGSVFIGSQPLSAVSSSNSPQFDDCNINSDGDLLNCGFPNVDQNEVRPTGETLTAIVTGFGHEQLYTAVPYLYKNGYNTASKSSFDDLDEVDSGDVDLSSDIRSSLETASTCTISINQITSNTNDYVWINEGSTSKYPSYHFEGRSGDLRWTVDDEDDDDIPRHPLNVGSSYESEKVVIDGDGNIACEFDYIDIYRDGLRGKNGLPPIEDIDKFEISDHEVPGASLSVDLEVDSDGDGVIDARDNCPDKGDGRVGDKGCPVTDSDQDGVFDRNDEAPQTPGSNSDGTPTQLESLVQSLGKIPLTPDGWSTWIQGEPVV